MRYNFYLMMKWPLILIPLLFADIGAMAQVSGYFDRGFKKESNTFVPKGFASTGLSISYNTYKAGNGDYGYDFFSIINDVQGNCTTFDISPSFSYFFARNTSAGFRVGYSSTSYDLDKASLYLDDDSDFDLSNHHLRSNRYSAGITLRNYVPLFGSRIFALFNEGLLAGSFGQSKSYEIGDNGKNGTFADNCSLSLGLNSGLCTFVADNFAFEVSIDVLGLEYSYSKQTENQEYVSNFSHFGASYKVKLATIKFSLAYFFNMGRRK